MANLLRILVEVILPLALVWLVGFLGQRLLHLDPQPFSRAGLYLLTPAVIFTTLMDSQITAEESGRILLVVVLLVGALWLISMLQALLLRLGPVERGTLQLSSIFINAVNYGFPATLLALGPLGLERAAVFAVGHALLNNTLGAFIAARGRAGGARAALRQVLRIPMVYAVLLAVVLRLLGVSFAGQFSLGGAEIALLPSVYVAIKLLSQAAVPVFMLVLGMQLGSRPREGQDHPRRQLPLALVAGLNRLVLSPVLAAAMVWACGLQGLAARATVLEAAMPTAVLSVILATEFEAQPRFVGTVVVGTTLASVVTVTALLSLWG